MDIETLEISASEFKKVVLKKFREKIFHITNEKNYKNILKSGAILATNDIENPNINWGSEENQSYFRTKNCISVCDLFHNKNEKSILDAMEEYRFYSPNCVVKENTAYYLILNKSIYRKCIIWDSLDVNKISNKKIVSNLESGIPNQILLSDVIHVIKLVTDEQSIREIEQNYTNYLNKGTKMTLEQLQQTIKEEVGVLLYFSGEHCSVCHALRPKFKELFDKEFPQLKQIYLDAHENPQISAHYSVFSVPTMIVFMDGREFAREGRSVSLHQLTEQLKRPYGMMIS